MCAESKGTDDLKNLRNHFFLILILVQACRVLNSTSCDCPTPDLSDAEVDTETVPSLGSCEFEMMYHDFQDNAEVNSSALTNFYCSTVTVFVLWLSGYELPFSKWCVLDGVRT